MQRFISFSWPSGCKLWAPKGKPAYIYRLLHSGWALGAVLIAAASCGDASDAQQQPAQPAAARVEAVRVVRQDLEHRLAVTGSLLPGAEATVSTEVSGRITERRFDVQQRVRKGDELAYLDNTEYRAQLAQARASLAQARLNAERAEQDLSRDTELLAAGSISQRAFDISKTARDAARAQWEAAEAVVTLSEKRFQDAVVRAPISGVVTARMIDVGDYVKAADPVATIMQVHPLKIEMAVPERFAAVIAPGQPLAVQVEAFPDRTFEGKVTRINPATDPATRTFSVEGAVPNPDGRLKPGFFAKATIVTRVTEQALVIPAEAVVTVDEKPSVFVVRNDVAVLTPVELGEQRNRTVRVLSGVHENDWILVSGHTTLTDGARVDVVRKSAP